jgi:uncharacterized protein (DUF58 family)
MFFGSRRAMKSVVAAELAALGAWRTLASGDRVGGIVFSESQLVDLRPNRSQNQVMRLLQEVTLFNQALALAPIASGDITLNVALEAASRRAVHDYLVVLISDLDGADQETQRHATKIAAHNDMLVLGIYDPMGAQLQPLPGMVAESKGTRLRVPNHASFTSDFQQAFSRLIEHWRNVFRALRVPVLPITTAEPIVDQVRTLFGTRSLH